MTEVHINNKQAFIVLPGSPLSRSTVVTAVKFTIVDHPMPIDSLLKGCIGKLRILCAFLWIINGNDIHFW